MCRRRARVAALATALFAVILAAPAPALAHGVLAKEDLPLPAWLFAWGASIVLIVSFAVLTTAWREPRLQADSWRPAAGWLSRALVNPVTEALAGLIGAGLLVLVVYAGLEGENDSFRNFATVFVFVTFWLGLLALNTLFGDVFRAFNPWRAIARGFGGLFRLIAGQSAPAPLSYPERLGRWPAVVGLIAFGWLELINGAAGAVEPRTVAIAALIYTALTFAGMALFGVERWIERGETFSVYFGMFARLSPLEVREGKLGVRRPLSGATRWGDIPGSLGMVIASIATTSFDGAQEGILSDPITWTHERIQDLGVGPSDALRLADTLWLAIVVAAVSLLIWLGLKGMHTVRDAPPVAELGRRFAHTLIPIALAYLVAHYFSQFVFIEQAQFTYVLSDPLANGSDLFGTADKGIDYGVIGATAVWYVQVAALVIGHVAALVLAHDRAIAIWQDYKLASRSQYWMLAVMVGFTCLGLLLLSQANT